MRDYRSGRYLNPLTKTWSDDQPTRSDLFARLRWLYGDPIARMTSPEGVADLTAWHRLGRSKP